MLCSILSVRELRTLLAQLYDIPVTLPKIEELEKVLNDCRLNYTGTTPSIDPVEFEILYDPNLVSKQSIPLPQLLYYFCISP